MKTYCVEFDYRKDSGFYDKSMYVTATDMVRALRMFEDDHPNYSSVMIMQVDDKGDDNA